MTTNKNHNSPNVPNLRFPEFEGNGKKQSLVILPTGFDYGMNAAAKNYDGVNKYIRITDIDEAYFYNHQLPFQGYRFSRGTLDRYQFCENCCLFFGRKGGSTGKSLFV